MSKALTWLKLHMVQVLVLLLVTVSLCCFVGQKQGYHMDEMLSFQLSNARFNPWIVSTQPQGRLAKFYEEEILGESLGETVGNLVHIAKDMLQNRGNSLIATYKADVYDEPVWIDREQFRDYITVEKGDAFFYPSVYFNVKDDNHPPLHFMALHTISSLFQGKAEPFMGCIINIGAVLGCCILIMRLGEMYGKKEAGIVAALLYGVSSGGIATVLLIRMYAVMTFFCVAFFYQNMTKWKKMEFTCHNGWLIAVTVLGFWTQYFFLFYCMGLAAVMAVVLLKDKKYRELGGYVRSMVIAAVIGVVGFPFAISDVFSSGRGVEALDNLSNGLDGYGERLRTFGEILITRVFGNVWFGLGVIGLMVLAAAALLVGKRSKTGHACPKAGRISGVCLLVIPPVIYFLLAARMSPYLVDRYIMAVFPFAAVTLAMGITRIGGAFGAVLVAIICMVNLLTYDGEYLYKGYDCQRQVSEEYRDLSCICIYDGVGYYENLVEFTNYEKTLLLKPQELAERVDKESLLQEEQVVVLIKQNADREEALRILEEQYGFRQIALLVEDSVYNDYVVLCEVEH